MADRAGYSIEAGKLPKGTDPDFDKGMAVVPQAIGYLLLLGMSMVGVSIGSYVGSVPWGATSPMTIAMAAASALAGNGRMTHLGLLASLGLTSMVTAELTRCVFPAVAELASQGHTILLFVVFYLVDLPILASPLIVRRMRETLWQDVHWALLDSLCYTLGIAKGAWLLSHVGDVSHDRYAIVKTVFPNVLSGGHDDDADFYLVDKMLGKTAYVGETPDKAETALQDLGYDVEHIEDSSNTIRRHEMTFSRAHHADSLIFENPPTKGLSAAEYYHRI